MLLISLATVGCGTTRWTDTTRTATEQLLISDAVDRAVMEMDFTPFEGAKVVLDPQFLDPTVVDKGYVISSLRNRLVASGCLLHEDRTKAEYIFEVRSGGIGTDRHDVLFGVPAMNIPTFLFATPGVPAQTPEIAIAKRTKQTGMAKVFVFAFDRETGRRVWQSGLAQESSYASATWVLGAGPFQRGSTRRGTSIAGEEISIPFVNQEPPKMQSGERVVPVNRQATWLRPPKVELTPATVEIAE